jgi:hypothetical protein
MRIGALPLAIMTPLALTQAAHTAQQAAGHSSTTTDRPVEPPGRLPGGVSVRRTSAHTFDIRV